MNASLSYLGRWKWCAPVVGIMLLQSLIPQIQLWMTRGQDWNGAYASLQGDEYLYSAYVNALIDGRPRRNDPFAGRDSTSNSPLPESTFSIQFLPAYVIALPARALGASASTAFIVLTPLVALLASLSLFWLLLSVTGNRKLAAVGVLVVLCCGGLAGDQGLLAVLLNHKRSFFVPFLRRYQPAAMFPVFFILCGLMWHALTTENLRRARVFAAFAGLSFGVLVFSYLYLWTTAAAWLGCLAVTWIYFRPAKERRRNFELFTLTGAIAILMLLPYGYLVSLRAASLDRVQVLDLTHRPDLLRIPEIIGVCILVILIIRTKRGKIEAGDARAVFAGSLALLPFVLFNQQVLTGRSMQPFHFEAFTANYAVLVGLVILGSFFSKVSSERVLVWITTVSLIVGLLEVALPGWARTRIGVVEDQMVPVLLRLKELAGQDNTLNALRAEGKAPLVFSPHPEVMGLLPTWAPQGTLLGAGALDFGSSASQEERKGLLYLQLYYSDVDAALLRDFLNERSKDSYMNFYAPSVVFGDERFLEILSAHSRPISTEEIEEEVQKYQSYLNSVSRNQLLGRPLTYLITRTEQDSSLSHIDRWYERDVGERIGLYNLYRLQLRKE